MSKPIVAEIVAQVPSKDTAENFFFSFSEKHPLSRILIGNDLLLVKRVGVVAHYLLR